ncbi:MAG: hypothetical protein ACRD98_11160, partial [Nitrososphaera sp.]
MEIDERAKEMVLTRYGLPPCLHVPIAAVDESAIRRYVGKIAAILAPGRPNKALLVQPGEITTINKRLP